MAYATCPLAYASSSAPVSYVLAGGECRVGSREGRGCKEVEVGARELQDSYRLAHPLLDKRSLLLLRLSLSFCLSLCLSLFLSLSASAPASLSLS